MIKLYSFVFAFVFSFSVFADEVNDKALRDTQALLRNQQQRNQVIQGDQRAIEADNFAGQAVGNNPALKNGVYGASADVMGTLHKQSGGDAVQMNAILQKAMQNPEAFLRSLPPDQQARIKALAIQAEAQQRKPSSPKP
jgi:hypothetical protein